MVGEIAPIKILDDSPRRQVTTVAVSFFLASLILCGVDLTAVTFFAEIDPASSLALLFLFPKIGLGFPLLCASLAAIGAWARHAMTSNSRRPVLASWNADIILTIPLLPLVFELFSGPAISGSPLRVPAWAGAVAIVFVSVRFLRWATGIAGARAADRPVPHKRLLSLAGLGVLTGALVLGRWTNSEILPGLYDAFHQLVTLVVVALSGAGVYVVLRAHPHRLPGRWAPVVLLCALAVTWIGGSVLATFGTLGRQLVTEHCPMVGPFVGPILVAEQRAFLFVTRSADTTRSGAQTYPFSTIAFDSESKRRSVLLISVDALRADALDPAGPFGSAAEHLIREAGSSLFFANAYAAANYTPYAIPGMALGSVPHKGAALSEEDCISTAFNAAGYRTEFFFTAHEYASLEQTDLWPLASQGFFFKRYHPQYEPAQKVLQKAQAILDAEAGPVFIWIHLSDVHSPFLMARGGGPGPGAFPSTYAGQLAYLDSVLGPFIAAVRTQYPDLIWALTADHGESLGEHGTHFHGSTLYDEQVKVPLLMGGPSVPTGRITGPVGTAHLGATLLKLAGATVPPQIPTLPLTPQTPKEPVLLVGRNGQCAVVRGNYKFMADSNKGTAGLFDLDADPLEKKNLISQNPALARELKTLTVDLGCIFDLGTVPL